MIKNILTTLILVGILYSFFLFLRSSPYMEDFLFYLEEKYEAVVPKEKVESFIEEKKENITEEIKDAGRSVWERIGDSIFKKNEKEDF